MQENAKVFVFEKKEIFLIFVFVVIMSVTCFTLGVNLGKKLSLDKAGITPEDRKTVQMKSTTEELADDALKNDTSTDEEKLKAMLDSSREKLNSELKDFAEDKPKASTEAAAEIPETKPAETVANPATNATSANAYTGKYTIQLGSYNTMEEAKQFAEGFSVRGYNPIVNEVVIPEKGTWYRVSLGVFESVAEAKSYIKKEGSLFQGQQYVISEIK